MDRRGSREQHGAPDHAPATFTAQPGDNSIRAFREEVLGVIDGDEPIIAYCRIGERSAHTWFVLI